MLRARRMNTEYLLQQLVERVGRGERIAWCVVVGSRGSTPQAKGAKMLVTETGEQLGTLGGGCVEAEVKKNALEMLSRGESKMLSFKLDHDYGWDDGLICGGIMDIAVWSLTAPRDGEPFEQVVRALSQKQSTTLSLAYTTSDGQRTYTETLGPAPKLFIAGAGHVGLALARVAADLDFDVTVIDDRPDCVSADRFPTSSRVVGEIEVELGRLTIDVSTYVVIVTRGHRHDGAALGAVVGRGAKYVGLIGSKRKVRTIMADLHARGVSRDNLLEVHAPVGLEIGAVTPAEIAISIAAELVAVRRERGEAPAASMKIDPQQLSQWLDVLHTPADSD